MDLAGDGDAQISGRIAIIFMVQCDAALGNGVRHLEQADDAGQRCGLMVREPQERSDTAHGLAQVLDRRRWFACHLGIAAILQRFLHPLAQRGEAIITRQDARCAIIDHMLNGELDHAMPPRARASDDQVSVGEIVRHTRGKGQGRWS